MKYMREKVCDVCGAKFMGGPCAMICPECRPLYMRRYNTLFKSRPLSSRDELRAAAIESVRAMRKIAAAPDCVQEAATAPSMRCGYCGRELGPRDARRGYCAACVAHGYHWLHEVTGRTARRRA